MIAPAAAPINPPAIAAPAVRPAKPPMSAPVPPPINAPPATRSSTRLLPAHPPSANAITTKISVLRIPVPPFSMLALETRKARIAVTRYRPGAIQYRWRRTQSESNLVAISSHANLLRGVQCPLYPQ